MMGAEPQDRAPGQTAGPNAATVMLASAQYNPPPQLARRPSAVDILTAMQPTIHLKANQQTSPTGQSVYRRLAAARGNRPIDPWSSALRLIMIVWGVLLLVSFATPVTTDPVQFQWDAILRRTGSAEVPLLLVAAIGFLGVVVGAIPMPTLARGILAALFGLCGIAVPIALGGELPPWTTLAPLAGVIVLVTSLIVRSEYTESLTARVLVTAGVVAMVIPLFVPQEGGIPLFAIIKSLIQLKPTTQQIISLIALGLALVSLLAWLPSPANGGAGLFAWLLLLLPMVSHILFVVIDGKVEQIPDTPHAMLAAWIPASGYLVLACYGLATAYGKVLE